MGSPTARSVGRLRPTRRGARMTRDRPRGSLRHYVRSRRETSPRAPGTGARSTARSPSEAGWPSSSSRSSWAARSAPRTLADEDTGNGSSRVADTAITDADFPEKADEQVLVQAARQAHGQGSRSSRPRSRTSSPSSKTPSTSTEVASPFAQGQRGPDLQGRPLRARHVLDPGRRERSTTTSYPRWTRPPPRRERIPSCGSSSSATPPRTRRSARRSTTTSSAPSSSASRSR